MGRLALFLKSHIPGYTKKDGTYVKPHDDKRQKAAQPAKWSGAKAAEHAYFAGEGKGPKGWPYSSQKPIESKPSEAANAHWHPNLDDKGKQVRVRYPHKATDVASMRHPDAIATFTPGMEGMPHSLNGVPFKAWMNAPTTTEEWANVAGQVDIEEPQMQLPAKKTAASGVVIVEPDGRYWLMAPTNRFGGYHQTFPKGQAEPELSLQANAIKEAYEETGLKVEILGFLGDFEKTTSVARYYMAKRVGGSPADMGWEAQALCLVPTDKLYSMLNMSGDHAVAEALGAGPAPKAAHKPQGKLF
jgi:ADP-ribose pyrophosphatase YjhB (NUDIX family)